MSPWLLFTLAVALVAVPTLAMQALTSHLYICAPGEALVFSGIRRALRDGRVVEWRVITQGRAFRAPLRERVQRLDLTPFDLDFEGGRARARLASDPAGIERAIERHLGRPRSETIDTARRIVAARAKDTRPADLRRALERELAREGLVLDELHAAAAASGQL